MVALMQYLDYRVVHFYTTIKEC